MLVRAGEGDWLELETVDALPPGGFRGLCGADAAVLLESDEPLPVVAFAPHLEGAASVDAICLTASGGVALVVAAFTEPAQDTLWRLTSAAGALQGMRLDQFAGICTELGHEWSLGQWLAGRVGGEPAQLEHELARVLEQGEFEMVLVTRRGPGALAAPLRWLDAGRARVRVYEVEILRAGDVQAVEGVEVTLDGEALRERRVPRQLAPEPEAEAEAEPASEPEPAPEPEPEPESQPEPEANSQPDPVAERAVEPAPVGSEPEQAEAAPAAVSAAGSEERPSDAASFLAAVDRLDHKAAAHMHFLHERVGRIVGAASYAREGDIEFVVGWLTPSSEAHALLGLDSRGSLQIVLSELPESEREEFASEVAGLIPGASGAQLLERGVAELSVLEHLNDETLLEYLLDNLEEALAGSSSEQSEPAAAEDDIGDDYFGFASAAGEEAAAAPAQEPVASPRPPAERVEPAASAADTQPSDDGRRPGGFGRMLRRRGNAA